MAGKPKIESDTSSIATGKSKLSEKPPAPDFLENYSVSDSISAQQHLAYLRVSKMINYDKQEIDQLLLNSESKKISVYGISDLLGVIRHRVFNRTDTEKILACLKVMYGKDGSEILPKISIDNKYFTNIVRVADPDTPVNKGQIIKVYTMVKDRWEVTCYYII